MCKQILNSTVNSSEEFHIIITYWSKQESVFVNVVKEFSRRGTVQKKGLFVEDRQ